MSYKHRSTQCALELYSSEPSQQSEQHTPHINTCQAFSLLQPLLLSYDMFHKSLSSFSDKAITITSIVIGRYRGPKQKLWAGYRAPSLKWTSLCMYSTFGHHPHPLGYLCVKCCFFCSLQC